MDVLFELCGLRIIIEGKFADHPNAGDVVPEDARKRVRSRIAHIAALRHTLTTRILVLRTSQLKYRIVAETHETDDWFEDSPALMDALRHAQKALRRRYITPLKRGMIY